MKSNSALKTTKLQAKEENASALRRPPVQSQTGRRGAVAAKLGEPQRPTLRTERAPLWPFEGRANSVPQASRAAIQLT
jgi:hypothetical protein